MKNLGILLSGRGSNFVAIADSIAAGRIPNARIAVVISNRADAPGLETARHRGLKALVIPSKGKSREEHDREVVAALLDNKVRSRLSRRLYASALARVRAAVSGENSQHPSIAATVVPGARSAATGVCLRRESNRVHGALRG
jgi:hypothetical protein